MSLRSTLPTVLLAAAAVSPLLDSPLPRVRQDLPIFSVRSELVVLDVVVRDRGGANAVNLAAAAFSVVEDGRPQSIQFFDEQDAPATVGLLIDSSGSMLHVKDQMIAAAAIFARTSNPADEIFALLFNDVVWPALSADEPFTDNSEHLQTALAAGITPRGRTAMFDAVTAGLSYLARGTRQRKILVIVSDGGDNASKSTTFDGVLNRVQASNVVIYTVALVDPLDPDARPQRLKALADATGGEAYAPSDVTHVEDALRRISQNIRNAYTLGYVSTNPSLDGRFRRVQVSAKAPDGRSLVVRTRRGYIVNAR